MTLTFKARVSELCSDRKQILLDRREHIPKFRVLQERCRRPNERSEFIHVTDQYVGTHANNRYPALNLQLWVYPNATEPNGVFIQPKFSRPHNFMDDDTDTVNDVEFTSNYKFDFGTLSWISLWRDRKDIQQFDNDLLRIQKKGIKLKDGRVFEPKQIHFPRRP